MTSDELRRLNIEIGRAEKEHDVGALERILHDRLVFRRANGDMVDKREYLNALPNTKYTLLQAEVEETQERNDVAVCAVSVAAKGVTPKGTEFSGVFENLRTFVRQDGRWQLLAWANTKVAELEGR